MGQSVKQNQRRNILGNSYILVHHLSSLGCQWAAICHGQVGHGVWQDGLGRKSCCLRHSLLVAAGMTQEKVLRTRRMYRLEKYTHIIKSIATRWYKRIKRWIKGLLIRMVMFPPTCSLPVPQLQPHLYPQTAGCPLDHPLMCSLDACWALDEEREVRDRHMSDKGVDLNVSNQFQCQGVQERYKISKAGACKAAEMTGNQMNRRASVCMKSSCFCFKLTKPLLRSFSVVSQHNYMHPVRCPTAGSLFVNDDYRSVKHHQGQLNLVDYSGWHLLQTVDFALLKGLWRQSELLKSLKHHVPS